MSKATSEPVKETPIGPVSIHCRCWEDGSAACPVHYDYEAKAEDNRCQHGHLWSVCLVCAVDNWELILRS